jgi:hypothetical protein
MDVTPVSPCFLSGIRVLVATMAVARRDILATEPDRRAGNGRVHGILGRAAAGWRRGLSRPATSSVDRPIRVDMPDIWSWRKH